MYSGYDNQYKAYTRCRPPLRPRFREQFFHCPQALAPIASDAVYSACAGMVSVFLENLSGGEIHAILQNSPDGVRFVDDPQIHCLQNGEITILVPMLFSKFMRLVITDAQATGPVNVWFQIQEIL
jgi:hypothetical protein